MPRDRFLPMAIVLIVLLALSAGSSAAQAPAPQSQAGPQAVVGSAFTYQGQLLKDGSPFDATCTMGFRLYNDVSAGSPVGSPITLTVTVANGLFTVLLNSAGEFGAGAFTGEARWLEVAVQCPGDVASNTLAPRQELTAAPYALSLRPGAIADGAVEGRSAMVVVNRAASGEGVWGQSDATDGVGVRGYSSASSGTTIGVYGRSESSAGFGVRGYSSASSGTTYGVHGRSDSTDGSGVYGWASAASGTTYGVYGQVSSTAGRGVLGYATATSGTTFGVIGRSDSTAGVGVDGYASAGSGQTYGVYGAVDSTDFSAAGVRGDATALSGNTFGVYGVAASYDSFAAGMYGHATALSGSGCGVRGRAESPDGTGVWGEANAFSGGSIGVGGITNSTDGWAVFALGNFAATGSKSAVVQTQGYGWRSLYSVESPEVLFEDIGAAQLVDGAAVVAIEPIFAQTVNLDSSYRVFLTPQGGYCALYVAEKSAAAFTVRAQEGASCQVAFDYRIIAKRLGYEGVRLAPSHLPARVQKAMEGQVAPAGQQ